ncbi:MAG: leucine-rich repeat domain-containing protein, partial [Rhodothermaceae bacterium]|nr:leucine-rich repeat domain-containing protein [Rhodothermaceae bacterium]
MSTHSQKTSEEFSVLSISSRVRKGMHSFRLSHVCSAVAFLSLLLPGQVLAQVSNHTLSKETEFEKERGLEEYITSTKRTPYREDQIRDERLQLKADVYGLFHDRLSSEMPVDGRSVVKPVAHMSMNICDRTAAVMDAILSRISATNDCSEVTSTQLAAIMSLNLQRRNISSLQEGDFDGLVSLTRLDLNFNDLSTLPADIFDELNSLTVLGLRGNYLSTLPDGIFDGLTSLTGLYLDQNGLSTLSVNIFDKLTSLTGLWLYHNDLSPLPNGIFDELTSLTWLDLGQNDLSTLP